MGVGRKSRDWPVEDIRRWVEVDGLTHREIGERLNCTNQCVSKLCRRYGIAAQRRGPRNGPGHPNWKGGRMVDADGYILIWQLDHPHARRPAERKSGGYVAEHRLVMEKVLGRYLRPEEVVHHKNGVHSDNRPENLEVFASNAEHLCHELTGRVPKWTEDGQARIRAGVERSAAKRRKPKVPDAPPSP